MSHRQIEQLADVAMELQREGAKTETIKAVIEALIASYGAQE